MSEKKIKKRSLFTIFAFLAAIAGALLISYSMASTSTTDYCMSCHEMKNYRDELKKSSHALDKNKVPIECGQCHVPNTFGLKYVATKSILGMKDMGVHYLGDPTSWARRSLSPWLHAWARSSVPGSAPLVCSPNGRMDCTQGFRRAKEARGRTWMVCRHNQPVARRWTSQAKISLALPPEGYCAPRGQGLPPSGWTRTAPMLDARTSSFKGTSPFASRIGHGQPSSGFQRDRISKGLFLSWQSLPWHSFPPAPCSTTFPCRAGTSRIVQVLFIQDQLSLAVILVAALLCVEYAARERLWCRFVCPQSYLLALAKLANPFRLHVAARPERCICRAGQDPCQKACSLDLNPKALDPFPESECTNCGDCVVVCRERGRALGFRFGVRRIGGKR